jgi:hypothetical protein
MAENHMKQGVRGVFAILFLLIAFVLLAAFNWSKPRILVLHSLDEADAAFLRPTGSRCYCAGITWG